MFIIILIFLFLFFWRFKTPGTFLSEKMFSVKYILHLTHSCVGMPQGLQALLSSFKCDISMNNGPITLQILHRGAVSIE